MSRPETARANILGTGVSAINMLDAVRLLESRLATDRKGYVCVTGVHGIMEAHRDSAFREILNKSFLTTPDGMPTVWVGRLQGHRAMDRVYGPDLMTEVCKLSQQKGYSHFLYGGKPGVTEQLQAALLQKFPGIRVVGTYAPPFRELNEEEEINLLRTTARLAPDLFWVGLSTPKQERFMAKYLPLLQTKLMIGVGAAFDIQAGLLRDAPPWVKHTGFQWCFRLFQEPRRLWKRYLLNNPRFLWKITLQLSGFTSYDS